jgi:hypothetical protein
MPYRYDGAGQPDYDGSEPDDDEPGTCPECGALLTSWYDGGEANNYNLIVPACSECDYVYWDNAEEAPDPEQEPDLSEPPF